MTRHSPGQITTVPYIADLGLRLGSFQNLRMIYYRTGDSGFTRNSKEWLSFFPGAGDRVNVFAPGNTAAIKEHLSLGGILGGSIPYSAGVHFDKAFAFFEEENCAETTELWLSDCWYEGDPSSKSARLITSRKCSRDLLDFMRGMVNILSRQSIGGQSHPEPESELNLRQAVCDAGEMSFDEYCSAVDGILDDIRSGGYYECNFTQRFRVSAPVEPVQVFSRLFKRLNPAKAFLLNDGRKAIVGASPEIFLVRDGENIATFPIKGSWPAATTVDPDLRGKLLAEHTMVIDLARNDLGRVCRAGSVQVPSPYTAESFGGMDHLVSRVTGKLSGKCDWMGILAGTFPAASITGAPKVAVTQAIAKYEKSPRGGYCGACGIIGHDFMDLNVAIRTLYCQRGESGLHQYTFGAGGAIVSDSDPAGEYDEMIRKALPLYRAISELR